MTEAIRLLSDPSATAVPKSTPTDSSLSASLPPNDPFSTAALSYSYYYTTDGNDAFPRPSIYESRRHAWLHIFPEGRIHQHPDKIMRYWKWGVARMILEAEPCPDVLAIWIDGEFCDLSAILYLCFL